MVYLYGSQVRCQVRLGQVSLGQVRCTCVAIRLGVHVRQLGQVLGQVRLGKVRLGQVRLSQVRIGQVYMYGSQVRCQVSLGYVMLGQVKYGLVYMYGSKVRCQDRLGLVRLDVRQLGQVRLGQVRCTCMNRNRNCLNFQNMSSKKVSSSFRWINLYHKSARIQNIRLF